MVDVDRLGFLRRVVGAIVALSIPAALTRGPRPDLVEGGSYEFETADTGLYVIDVNFQVVVANEMFSLLHFG